MVPCLVNVGALAFATLSLCSLLVADAASRWQAYDNYPCPKSDCPNSNPEDFKIEPYNKTVLSYACIFNYLCHDTWTFGKWPVLNNAGTEPVSNGGVPQRANLTLHLNSLRSGVDAWIPDHQFDGNAVLDWEHWTPNWDLDESPAPGNWMSSTYRTYSMKLVKDEHPSWNHTQIEAQAKFEFETAALTFMVETLRVLREARPLARIGYYGYPRRGTSAKIMAADDALAPIWNLTTGFFPSVYLPAQGDDQSNEEWQAGLRAMVKDTVAEAIRVAKTFNPTTPILPYHWSCYHNGTTLLTKEDLTMVLEETFVPPHATGLVIWGAHWGNLPAVPKSFADYMRSVEGPMFLNAYNWANQCSSQYCSGHGWCESLLINNASQPNGACICEAGWSGLTCATPIL